jgi:ABC-type polysaccharide/polyol phosphate export permease
VPGVSDHPRLVDLVHWGNPLTPAVEAVRDPLFFGELPAAGDVLYLAVSAVLSLAAGAWVFSRIDDRVAVEV